MLQDETCALCGNPIWICRNESATNVGFKTKTIKCFAKAELDAHEERESKKKTNRKRHGEQTIVVPYTYDESEFPSRMSYYEDLMRQHGSENNEV